MKGTRSILRAAAAVCALLLCAPAGRSALLAGVERMVEKLRSASAFRSIDLIAAQLRSVEGLRK